MSVDTVQSHYWIIISNVFPIENINKNILIWVIIKVTTIILKIHENMSWDFKIFGEN
jgi:hypothetical protein